MLGFKDKKGNFHPINNSRKIQGLKSEPKPQGMIKSRFLQKTASNRMLVRTLENSVIPTITNADPNFATAYILFRFAQYGFKIIIKIQKNYQLSHDLPKAILNTFTTEIEKKISSYLELKLFENAVELIVDELWNTCRKETEKLTFYSPLENKIKKLMIAKIYPIFEKDDLQIILSQEELERSLYEIYFEELLKNNSVKNKITYRESELILVSERLAKLLINERDVFVNPSEILCGTFDAKTWLENKISTKI